MSNFVRMRVPPLEGAADAEQAVVVLNGSGRIKVCKIAEGVNAGKFFLLDCEKWSFFVLPYGEDGLECLRDAVTEAVEETSGH